MRLTRSGVENALGFVIGSEWLALLNANRANWSIMTLSRVIQRSPCTKRSSDWKKRMS
jgi:hypothetical protein